MIHNQIEYRNYGCRSPARLDKETLQKIGVLSDYEQG